MQRNAKLVRNCHAYTVTQWCSRTFGRSGRWSNLPPFRLRFCVTSCYLRKERTNIRYIMAPTQNWRRPNTNKVEPDAAKDPMLLPRILRIDTRCSCNALFLLHANTYEITIWFSREFLETIFARLPPLASAARCGPHSPHPLATPLLLWPFGENKLIGPYSREKLSPGPCIHSKTDNSWTGCNMFSCDCRRIQAQWHGVYTVQPVVQPVGWTVQMSPAKRRLSRPARTLMTSLGWRAARRLCGQ